MARIGKRKTYCSAVWLIALGWLLVPQVSWAGVLTGELDKAEGTLNDTFVYTLTIEGEFGGRPDFPNVEHLTIERGGTSTMERYINGHHTSQTQYTYYLVPEKVGTFDIPAIRLEVDGEMKQTLPLTLTVTESDERPGEQNKRPFFVERSVSVAEAYVGEAFVVTDRVYMRVRLLEADLKRDNLPQAFRQLETGEEKRYQKRIGDQTYTVIELKTLVVPTKPGDYELPAAVLNAAFPDPKHSRNRSRLFDDIFGRTRLIKRRVRSDEIAMTVKPLPAENRRADYSGLVGDFSLEKELSQSQVDAGETVMLSVRITGDGLTDGMASPKLDLGSDVKVYEEKPVSSDQVQSDQVQGERVLKFALVPLKPGRINLGKLEIQTFNPEKNGYEVLTTELGELVVTAKEGGPGLGTPPQISGTVTPDSSQTRSEAAQDVELLGDDIVGLHDVSEQLEAHGLAARDWVYAGLISGSGLLFSLGGWVYQRRRQTAALRGQRKRQSQAAKVFSRAIASYNEPSADNVSATAKAFRRYLSDKAADDRLANSSRQQIRAYLTNCGVDADLCAESDSLLEKCDELIYSDKADTELTKDDIATIHRRFQQLIRGLEEQCKV
jgi:hypothetical protein